MPMNKFRVAPKIALLALVTLGALLSSFLMYLAIHGRNSARSANGRREHVTETYKPFAADIDDWTLSCSNLRLCTVSSVDENGEHGGFIEIVREAGPTGTIGVTVSEWRKDGWPDISNPKLDGALLPEKFSWRRDTDRNRFRLDGGQALTFVRAIARGTILSFGRKRTEFSVSMIGLHKALIQMDSTQHRASTTTAIAQAGALPAAAVPLPPAAPILQAFPQQPPLAHGHHFASAVRQAEASILQARECETDMREDHWDEAYTLDEKSNLVILGCFMAPYQGSQLVFIAPKADPRSAKLLVLPMGAVDPHDCPNFAGELVNAEWDPKASTLKSETLGRGIADCGEDLSWVYVGDGRWELSEQRLMGRCGGGIWPWPQVYKATVITSGPSADHVDARRFFSGPAQSRHSRLRAGRRRPLQDAGSRMRDQR